MDFGGWYGRDNDFRTLIDCQFISAMGPPGGGRNFVSNRYLRHFNQIGVALVCDLYQIFLDNVFINIKVEFIFVIVLSK